MPPGDQSGGSAAAAPNPPVVESAKERKARRIRLLKRVLIRSAQIGGALCVVGVITLVLVIRSYEQELPDVQKLKTGYDPPQTTRIVARDGAVLATIFTERRTVVPFKSIAEPVKLAFLAAEDARFYEHEGLNYFGMLRALWVNLRAGRTIQGGSTITQQVVKNILLDPERTYTRKIKETLLARRLEQELDKDEIFGLYLNHIYLGHGRYGVEEAARYYFGKSASKLDLPDAALLAGLVAAPERFSPRRAPERSLDRKAYVLRQMQEKGFLASPDVFAHAMAAPLRIAPAAETEPELIPEVTDEVKRTLELVAGEHAKRGGYTVYTTIDPTLQAAARKALRDNLATYASRQKIVPPFTADKRALWGDPFVGEPKAFGIYAGLVSAVDDRAGTIDVRVGNVTGRVYLTHEERYNPEHLVPSAFTKRGALLRVALLAEPERNGPPVPLRLELGPQSALVAADVRSGEIRALVGSYEALAGGLDRTNSKRQPGSAFKPITYSYALYSRRITPATVLDLPPLPPATEPRRMSVRAALAASENSAAYKVLEEVGAPNVVEWAHALGITTKLEPTPSLTLGAYEVQPRELVNAYLTFARGGEYRKLRLITRITGPDGAELPLPENPPDRRVMSEAEAYLTTSLLRSVVETGTAKEARNLKRPAAGKTGTTNDSKDTWFVGYTTDLVTGVWVGFDDARSLDKRRESGARTALPAWVAFMQVAHAGRPVTEFPKPQGITSVSIDPATGLLAYPDQADALSEDFLDGTAPEKVSEPDGGVPEDGPADGGVETDEPLENENEGAAIDGGVEAGSLPEPEPPPF